MRRAPARTWRRLAPTAALAALAASLGFAQAPGADETAPVRVAAHVSKSTVTVGEAFTLEVRAEGPAGTEWTFPSEIAEPRFELHAIPGDAAAAAAGEAGAKPRTDGASPQAAPPPPGTQRYEATVFALDDVELPALKVAYRLPDGTAGEAETAPVTVTVASLLPKDPQARTLADIRGPFGLGVGAAFWVALAALAVAVAAAAVWLWRRRRHRRALEQAALLRTDEPPASEARRRLASLAASARLERGDSKGYYVELAAIAKRYLERRLGAPVVEMTTAELLGFLRDHDAGRVVHAPMRELSQAADHVKFARGSAVRAEAERHRLEVEKLVSALEERLRLAPEAGTGETGEAA